jgi:hypothetical protein
MSRDHLLMILTTAALTVTTALAQQPPDFREAVVDTATDLWQIPNQITKGELIKNKAVRVDLKISAEQTTSLVAIGKKNGQKWLQKMREQRTNGRDILSKESLEERSMIEREGEAAIEEKLTPSQRVRLDQVQLQVQNAGAFERVEVQRRLELSADQVSQLKKISNRSWMVILRAPKITIAVTPRGPGGSVTLDDVRAYVKTPEFGELHRIGIERVRVARLAMMNRIAAVLNDRQNTAYGNMLGESIDASILRSRLGGVESLTQSVAHAFGLAGGPGGADPDFDTKVARPANVDVHPRVMIDESHHNFHSVSDHYRPLAQLIANDGYRVVFNRAKFTKESLKDCDILLIANACAPETTDPFDAKPAFTDTECDAVRLWVEHGGSLLLIADEGPLGTAVEGLAGRFGVDMRKGETHDESNSAPSRPTSLLFTRSNKLLADHPITHGRDEFERVNCVQTYVGQSLSGPPGTAPILKLARTAVDHCDDREVSASGRSQGLAFAFGNGRMVVLGDAATLSAEVFSIRGLVLRTGLNQPGIDNRQFALNILHWLSGILEPRDGDRKKSL